LGIGEARFGAAGVQLVGHAGARGQVRGLGLQHEAAGAAGANRGLERNAVFFARHGGALRAAITRGLVDLGCKEQVRAAVFVDPRGSHPQERVGGIRDLSLGAVAHVEQRAVQRPMPGQVFGGGQRQHLPLAVEE
jgi:hypothetical protein